jgi:hypothetical protein
VALLGALVSANVSFAAKIPVAAVFRYSSLATTILG